jgi:DNA polymerase-3 subunit alpha
MLDGAARIGDLVDAAVTDGMPAIGITDHGNMYGVLDFYKACQDAGINPIIGTEAYMAANSRFERPVRRGKIDDGGGDTDGGNKLYYHLTLLAESTRGYRNLMKLSSAAYLEGYYYKPRLDWELLEQYHEGIIATTGCLGGVVLQALLAGKPDEATRLAARLQDIFGKESLFVEIQDHGLAEQKSTNPQLIEIAKKIGAPLIATNDSHYTHREDHEAHDALLCVQTGSLLSDANRFKFEGNEHYLKSAEEMRYLFREVETACDSTLIIAERAKVEIELGKPSLPEFPVPDEFRGKDYQERSAQYLRSLTMEGARRRYGDALGRDVQERIDYELSVIADMGFSAYFLVVWDLIAYARRNHIRVGPGRGSAAGCCVAYCLEIVDLDPIRYDLLFERFLNPGRKQMPDIDMDFDDRYRGEMIKYAAERYGSDHVAQIITFSTIKARAAVRDAARVLDFAYADGDRVAKAMPPVVMGRDVSLSACFEKLPGQEDGYMAAAEIRQMYATDEVAKRILDVARGLEGLRRGDGIHAAAVVITRDPLIEHLPIQRKPDASGNIENAPIVTQFEMHGVEELGLLKMDFLGLRNLSVIEQCLDLVERSGEPRPDIDKVDLDDDMVFSMLRRGESVGVFQLEGRPMRALMRSLAPTSFDDVAALVALYRPGPMSANMHNDYADRKNGRQAITYQHDDLAPLLGDTQGLMIYQESVMRVAQKFAGYSLEEADNLRKACGKKIRELIAAEREKFVSGCVTQGYGEELGTELFDIIEPFADYAFNKSHSYGYGLVAYQTAWLKAHYPVEYMAALLTTVSDDKDKTAVYLSECRSMGIEVVVPDVNRSLGDFAPRVEETTSTKGISFGLASVRNVGESLVERIVVEREANGTFSDFYDFCRRVDTLVLNRRTIESLIKAGAFDAMGHPRQGLALVADEIIERTVERRKERDLGISTLFASAAQDAGDDDADWEGTSIAIPDREFDKATKLAFEKEMLGLYISDHPLMGLERALARHTDATIADLKEIAEGSSNGASAEAVVRQVGGVVTEMKTNYTKKGELMARFMLEDLQGSMEVFVFPKAMADYGSLLDNDAIVVIRGRVDTRDEVPKITAMQISRPTIDPHASSELRLNLPLEALSDSTVNELKGILQEHPGESPVFIHMGEKVLRLPPEFNVNPQNVVGEIRRLLGANAILAA